MFRKQQLMEVSRRRVSTTTRTISEINRQARVERTNTARTRPALRSILMDELKRKSIRKYNDQLIRNDRFQEVLDRVIKGYLLSERQAEDFYNKVKSIGNHSLKITTRLDTVRFIAFNEATVDFIIPMLTEGFIEQNGKQTFGSDLVNHLTYIGLKSVEIIRLEKSKQNKNGGFFPYINKTKLDLSRYQIYTQDQAAELKEREHCFIEALLLSGVDKALVNQVKLSILKGCAFKKSDIHKVAELINKRIVLHWVKPDGRIKREIYNHENENIIKIAIYEDHYFIYEDTPYKRAYINQYPSTKNLCDKTKMITSLKLVDKLFKQGKWFEKLDMSMFAEMSAKDHIYLDNIDEEQEECISVRKQEDQKKTEIFYADCESFTTGENHELYLLGCVSDKNDFVTIYNVCDTVHKNKPITEAQNLVYSWLKQMTKNGTRNVTAYFHNLKYDYTVLKNYLNIRSICEKDNQIYNVVCSYKNCTVELRDSYKLAPMALNKFQKEFELDKKFSKGEAINYAYYTRENNNKDVDANSYMEGLSKKEKVIFKENVKTKTFNATKYYIDYLRLDCLVLKKGLQKFDDIIQNLTECQMSIYDSLTISSLTDKFVTNKGSFDGVYKMKGNLRAYVAKAVYGGRVCVNPKFEKQVIEEEICDYDGVSLYPSAIERLCREKGLPCGKAKRYESKEELSLWQEKVYSVLTVRITKVNKTQQIPFISYKDKEGISQYTNEVPKEPVVIDSITLEDYIKFHAIEYQLIDGVYWDGQVNRKMGEVINTLFEFRLKAKDEKKDALQLILKLMLNSAYGKTVMKKTNTRTKIIKTNDNRLDQETGKWVKSDKLEQFNNYVINNFNTIKSWMVLNDKNIQVEEICVDTSYNRAHIGAAILSMSKRIMNEVLDTANENNLVVYYTDTDSIHMKRKDVKTLENKYEEKYNRKLNGVNLGQFHSDFKLKGADAEVYATTSIFLGKKSYMDKLVSKDEKGNIIHGYHLRMKGVTEQGLEDAAKRYKDSYLGLYKELAEGKEVEFILNPYNKEEEKQKVMFDFTAEGTVKTKEEFKRVVQFSKQKKPKRKKLKQKKDLVV